MVHQDQAGLILGDILKSLVSLIMEPGSHEAENTQHTDQGAPEDISLAGRLMLGTGQRDHFVVGQFFDRGLQMRHVLPKYIILYLAVLPLYYTRCSCARQDLFTIGVFCLF